MSKGHPPRTLHIVIPKRGFLREESAFGWRSGFSPAIRDHQNDPALAAEITLRSPQLCHPDGADHREAMICGVEGPCVS